MNAGAGFGSRKKRRVTIEIQNERGTVRVEADRDDIEAAVAAALQ